MISCNIEHGQKPTPDVAAKGNKEEEQSEEEENTLIVEETDFEDSGGPDGSDDGGGKAQAVKKPVESEDSEGEDEDGTPPKFGLAKKGLLRLK